jgi:type III restriction enzyme
VEFDSNVLVQKAADKLNAELSVSPLTYTTTSGEGYLEYEVTETKTKTLERSAQITVKYDIARKLADGVNLSRKTVIAVLKKLSAEKIKMFAENPEEFITKVTKTINESKADIVVQAIKYVPSAEPEFTREIFNMSRNSEEYANAFAARKAIQEYIFTDGSADKSIERRFAEDLDVAEEVIAYAKLPKGPKGFYIPTPVGNYSPDWAISFKKDSVQYIYFIAETKGTMDESQFRPIEKAKMDCAKKLFNTISTTGVKYHYVDSYRTLIDDVMNRTL